MNTSRFICRISICLICTLPFWADAQDGGIKFESGLSWNEIQAKAKAEQKYIFMDCFATWCGPCKYMDRNIFPQKEAGDFFNAHFVNVRVQMDTTPNDPKYVRDWHNDAVAIAKKYQVGAYPTYLFFSPDGTIVHRGSGSTENAAEFIAKASDALDSTRQYYTVIERKNEYKRDSVSLIKFLTIALSVANKERVESLANDYLESLRDPFTKEDLKLIGRSLNFLRKATNGSYPFFLNNAKRIDEVMEDPRFAERILGPIIFDEEVVPMFASGIFPVEWKSLVLELQKKYSNLNSNLIEIVEKGFESKINVEIRRAIESYAQNEANWDSLSSAVSVKFPDFPFVNRLLLVQEVNYFGARKLWHQCEVASIPLLRKYGDQLGRNDVNNISWYFLFLRSDDHEALTAAARCIEGFIKKNQPSTDIGLLDTYANLLYKIGERKKAIDWENKIIQIATNEHKSPDDIKEFRTTLGKMVKGEPTWSEVGAS